ncbi:hypothetical protein [Halopiger xanaduensis]|uniref:Uncharacterized protein n=1 Tax=Halopiger xanaduensis (strain DSM 18323 / JCM 14033 / SH-6) TaxID=797210 RepID=F8D5E0_HALXS|nr:hypothetical protein [Halopiger xanaduensis]AEH37645.1 hypothetical protein Halxa_3030 [Halopiger xanaduensis SH-6]
MSTTQRNGTRLIGAGIGFVVLAVALGFVFDSLVHADFVRYLSTNTPVDGRQLRLFGPLFDPFNVGVVYLVFGTLVVGWTRATQSTRFPFVVTLSTAIGAVVVLFGLEFASAGQLTSPGETLRELVATNRSFWVGYYLAWLLAFDVAATRRQRACSVAGIAVLPPLVAAYGVRAARSTLETGGPGAGLGYVAAAMAIAASLIAIPVAIVFATPWYALRSQLDRRPDESGFAAARRSIRDRRIPELVAFLGLFVALATTPPLQFVDVLVELTGSMVDRTGCGRPCIIPILLSRYVYVALFAVVSVALARRLWHRLGPSVAAATRGG